MERYHICEGYMPYLGYQTCYRIVSRTRKGKSLYEQVNLLPIVSVMMSHRKRAKRRES